MFSVKIFVIARNLLPLTAALLVYLPSYTVLHAQTDPPELSAEIVTAQDVALTFVRRTGRPAYRLSSSDVQNTEIVFQSVTVRPRESLIGLLTRHSIVPNPDAYSLVYAANPDLEDVDRLRAGANVRIPIVEGPPHVERALERDYITEIQAFVGLRSSLRREIASTSMLINVLLPKVPQVVADEGEANRFKNTLERIQKLSDDFAPDKAVGGRATMEQIIFETRAVNSVLADLIGDANATTNSYREKRELIAAIGEDLDALGSCARTAINCERTATVRTIGRNNVEHRNLQVYAAPRALATAPNCRQDPGCLRSFRKLSSPAEHELPAGPNFVIWAERNGRVISEMKAIQLARSGSNDFDLLIP